MTERRWMCVACWQYPVVPGTQRCDPCTARQGKTPTKPTVSRDVVVKRAPVPCEWCGKPAVGLGNRPVKFCCRLCGRRSKRAREKARLAEVAS